MSSNGATVPYFIYIFYFILFFSFLVVFIILFYFLFYFLNVIIHVYSLLAIVCTTFGKYLFDL